MSNDGTGIPAGWYADPADPAGRRWWDGTAWTAEVQSPAPIVSTFGSGVPLVRGAQSYVPLSSGSRIAPATMATGIAHTRAARWIVAHPLWGVVPPVVIVALDGMRDPLPLSLGLFALSLLFWGILLGLAFADRAALLSGGNNTAASPWWMLLSPLAYLIARAVEVSKWEVGGWGLVIWWVIATVLSPVVALAAVFAALNLIIF